MKKFKLVLSLTALFTLLFVVRCSKSSDPAPLVSISGNISFTDMKGATANAAGAVVYLAKSSTATTTYDQSTIADASGNYQFANLSAGSYYLNAVYQTDNKNISARLDGMKFTTASGYTVTAGSTNLTQDMALVSAGQTGTEAIQVSYQWDPTASSGAGAYTNTGAWVFDNIHSPVQFQFPYRGAEADFKGSFIQTAALSINFDASNLAGSSIVAKVDLLSINTGTPGGRDAQLVTAGGTFQNASTFVKGKLGCIAGTFGITADDATADPNAVTTDVDRYATFTSTSITTYGDGYLAKGNLVFHGKTVSVGLMFKYVAPLTDTSVVPNKKYVSFEGKMTIQAKTDFALVSTSIADLITIYITVNLNKNA